MWLACPGSTKLAQPDFFYPRIVLAGSRQQVAGTGNDAGFVPVLRRRGLHIW
ncbi:hypothetical protein [Mycobacterium uberis]|uniref:hypothetical protein n=1 Tax=Mycobacterium uberis TaxID=2162698 RepID=UPI001FB50B62|nr:hypothetical protein [Mycobacterium uberis]